MNPAEHENSPQTPGRPPSPAWLPPLRFAPPLHCAPQEEQSPQEEQLERQQPAFAGVQALTTDEDTEAANPDRAVEEQNTDWTSLDSQHSSNEQHLDVTEEEGDRLHDWGSGTSEDEEDDDSEDYEEDEWEEQSESQPTPSEILESLQQGFEEIKEVLHAGNTESRRSSKRVMEILRQFGQILDAVSATVRNLHESTRQAQIEAKNVAPTSQSHQPTIAASAFIEFCDRLKRIRDAADAAPPPLPVKSWFGGNSTERMLAPWKEERLQLRKSLSLLEEHAAQLLQNSCVEPIPTSGKIFDPSCMIAVETIADDSLPDHTVASEILTGWKDSTTGKVLRAAQVRVARLPNTSSRT